MPTRGRKPTAAMPTFPEPAGPVRANVPPPPPHHGWLISRKPSAWKDFEPCRPEDQWAEPAGEDRFGNKLGRRKVIKVQCHHRRGTGGPARAVVRGADALLEEVYRNALIVPCQYTECPYWNSLHYNEHVR